ncbi:MAG: hypothetical protein ACREPM_08850 [Gemmatimonadaceae bacterium]
MKNGRSPLASLGMTTCLLSALGCGQAAGAKPVPPATNQFIVGIDLSASRSVEALRDSRRLLDNLIESRLHNGDELVLLEMYGSSDTGDHQWIDSVPRSRTLGVVTPTDRRRLDDFKAVAHQVVGAMFDPSRVRKIGNTDVFGTISRASDYAKAARDRRPTLILLSDMEHSTDEMRMERDGGIPSPRWIEVRRGAHRLPEMRGVCVVVAGADSKTQREAAIRDFWVRYFAASGSALSASNYRAFVPDAMELRC